MRTPKIDRLPDPATLYWVCQEVSHSGNPETFFQPIAAFETEVQAIAFVDQVLSSEPGYYKGEYLIFDVERETYLVQRWTSMGTPQPYRKMEAAR